MVPSADQFVQLIETIARAAIASWEAPGELRVGTVDWDYPGIGQPLLTFDGETALSTKTYPRLLGYTPAAGDRVAVLQSANSALILGAIG